MTSAAGLNEAEVQDQEARPAEASVGVLGWLGFIIINFAIWGIIATSSWIAWGFGFGVCLIYTAGLIALALWLERRGGKYRQFVNLLWVLACWFVFILGIYISVQIIGRAVDGDVSSHEAVDSSLPFKDADDLSSLVPDNSSEELKSWADGRNTASATFTAFNGSLFFRGRDSAATRGALWYTHGEAVASKVLPELEDPGFFVELGSDLYFAAMHSQTGSGSDAALWRIGAGEPGAAEKVVGSDKRDFRITGILEDAGLLFLKVSYSLDCTGACSSYTWVNSLFQSDGSAEGTVDLMTDPCTDALPCGGGGGGFLSGDKPSLAALWGIVFVATVPMVLLAWFVLFSRKLPGPVVNVFGGILCAVVTLYLIFKYDDDDLPDRLPSFLKWFITIYSSLLWVGLVAWSLLSSSLDPWLEEFKTWAVAIVGVTFFVIIHFDLEVPFTNEAWHWVVYAALALFQLVISAAISRTVPMVAGAIGLFVLAWKVAFEIVNFANIGSDELQTLTMLAILALQGIGIIAAAIFYAGNRDAVDGAVRRALLCGRSPSRKPEP